MRTFLLLVCILLPVATAAQGEHWCWDADVIQADVEGDVVRLRHLAALLNCCPDPITFEIEIGDATILVVEHSQDPCDCQCCYNLEVTLDDVPPGLWNVLYRWFDFEIWDWAECVLEIVVPDVGQPMESFVADQMSLGCLETAGLPEPSQEFPTWGLIKARYR